MTDDEIDETRRERAASIVNLGCLTNLIGNIGTYVSLLGGISAVLQEHPDIERAFYAGVGFCAARAVLYLSTISICGSDSYAQNGEINKMLSDLEKRLKG